MEILRKIYPLFIIAVVYLLAVKVFIPLWYKVKLKAILKRSLNFIEFPDENGFQVCSGTDSPRIIKWSRIKRVDLLSDQKIEIHFNDSSTLLLMEQQYSGWFPLIKAIPDNISVNKELTDFKQTYFSNLLCCKICGKIAVKKDYCLNCSGDTYEEYLQDLKKYQEENILTETAYIKKNQLDWFSGSIKEYNVDFYSVEIPFNNCADWSPTVTATEVIKYNKEQDS